MFIYLSSSDLCIDNGLTQSLYEALELRDGGSYYLGKGACQEPASHIKKIRKFRVDYKQTGTLPLLTGFQG